VHPFYVGTQAHPELKSRPTRPHPLFRAFIQAAVEYSEAVRLPVELPDDAAVPAGPDGLAANGTSALQSA
jgi:CTP synthase